MATIAMTLGGKNKIATIVATDTNGNVISPTELTYTYVAGTPGIVNESAIGFNGNNFQLAAVSVGSTTTQFSAQLVPSSGGGPVVAAASDTVTVSRAPIQNVTVSYVDAS